MFNENFDVSASFLTSFGEVVMITEVTENGLVMEVQDNEDNTSSICLGARDIEKLQFLLNDAVKFVKSKE